MATSFNLEIIGLDELRRNLKRFPEISAPILANAINASLAVIQQEANDDNFQFVTPRALRTGKLQLSFKYGLRAATNSRLYGSIGPTVKYAPWVHEGHSQQPGRFVTKLGKRLKASRVVGNPFMGRILEKAQPQIDQLFTSALQKIVSAI